MPIKYKLIVIFVSLSLGIVSASLFVYWLKSDISNKQVKAAQQHIAVVNRITSGVNETLDALNKFNGEPCSPQMMILLRRAMFKSTFIKDMGYVDDNGFLQCTTGLGTLNKPIKEDKEDYISEFGSKVWVNRELVFFDKLYKSFIIQKKNFNAVVDPKDINKLISQDFVSEVVYRQGNDSKHILGKPNHYQTVVDHLDDFLGLHHYQQCSDLSSYCVSVTLKEKEFLKRYGLALTVLLFTSLLLILTTYLGLASLIRKHLSLESRIRRGIKHDSFYPLFQPIVELESGKIIGCEILARYKDGLGVVYPDSFIPVIRDLGLSWQFTDQLFTKSMSLLNQSELGGKEFRVNLNIFPCDISSGNVLRIISHSSVTNDFNFSLEIVEDEKLIGEDVVGYLETLTSNGFSIAIDDFGTGYSNLHQISKIQCHTLKIDRSFVNEMEGDSIRSTLIPHIVEIANKLEMCVVAEGIENAMQQRALLNEGVRYGQGWMYGKPMTAHKLSGLVSGAHQS